MHKESDNDCDILSHYKIEIVVSITLQFFLISFNEEQNIKIDEDSQNRKKVQNFVKNSYAISNMLDFYISKPYEIYRRYYFLF
jgi:hypothetical protein